MLKRCFARVLKSDGSTVGNAFLVTDSHLLTCAHVVNYALGLDTYNKTKPSDPLKVEFPVVSGKPIEVEVCVWHPVSELSKPVSDIAVLKVLNEVPRECEPGVLYRTIPGSFLGNQSFYAHGFPESSKNEERLTHGHVIGQLITKGWLQVEATRESVGNPIEPGFSGGPAWGKEVCGIIGMIASYDNIGGKREGFIISPHLLLEAWPELEKHGYFKTEIETIVSPVEISELRELLAGVKIPDSDAESFFRICAPNSRPFDSFEKNTFYNCIEFLARKEHVTEENAPLLEFLEYCHPLIALQSKDVLSKLEDLELRISERLGININSIHDRIQRQACKPEVKSYSGKDASAVTLKIEPKDLVDKKQFTLRAWLYHNKQYEPIQTPDKYYSREDLEKQLPSIIGKAILPLGSSGNDALLEFILPIGLFDWNLNKIKIEPSSQIPLGTIFPIALRSWDRIYSYSSEYVLLRPKWPDKWKARPCTLQEIRDEHIRCQFNADISCETMFYDLCDNCWVFLALFPMTQEISTERIQEIFGTILTAGLPFAFWSVQKHSDFKCIQQKLEILIRNNGMENWPQALKEQRLIEKRSHVPLVFWDDVLMLWDNPERLPPDTDYTLLSPNE